MPVISNEPRCEFADSLFNDPSPNPEYAAQDVQCEKPWHRLAILMAASGSCVTEIANKLERSVTWVSLLLRQPWARERLTREINEAGRDEIETLFKSAGPDAVRRLVQLSESAANEGVKLAANRDIIDRLCGKPVQKVESTSVNVNVDPSQLDAEIKKLEAEENRLLGRN